MKKHLGITTETRLASLRSQVAEIDEEILQRFDVDTRGVIHGSPDQSLFKMFPNGSYRDEWGVVRSKPQGIGHYIDTEHPFAGEPKPEDIDKHDWFDPDDPG